MALGLWTVFSFDMDGLLIYRNISAPDVSVTYNMEALPINQLRNFQFQHTSIQNAMGIFRLKGSHEEFLLCR